MLKDLASCIQCGRSATMTHGGFQRWGFKQSRGDLRKKALQGVFSFRALQKGRKKKLKKPNSTQRPARHLLHSNPTEGINFCIRLSPWTVDCKVLIHPQVETHQTSESRISEPGFCLFLSSLFLRTSCLCGQMPNRMQWFGTICNLFSSKYFPRECCPSAAALTLLNLFHCFWRPGE